MPLRTLQSKMLRISGFALIPMLSIASPLLALPAVTQAFGAPGWAAVAIGQSVGGAAAVLLELGWALSGSQRVAPLSPTPARRILTLSLVTKACLLMPVLAAAAAVSLLLSSHHGLATALTALGTALSGLSCVWFYIGRSKLRKILTLDAIPRLLGVIAASLWILTGGPLWAYPVVGIIFPSIASLMLVIAIERLNPRLLRGFTLKRILLVLRFQANALTARSLSALYISLPVAIVSIVSPNSVPLFAAVERLQRMTLQILAAVPNAMQNWIGGAKDVSQRMDRSGKAILYNGIFGIIAGVCYGLIVPFVGDLVFSGIVTITPEISVLSGILIFIVCLSRATGSLALVALRKIKVITWSAVLGSTIGLLSLFILGRTMGTEGALLAEIAAEVAVLATQIFCILIYRRRLRKKTLVTPALQRTQ